MGRLLVGRAAELHTMQLALRAVARGQGRVLLVTGEPGIGKSRLCEELTRLAERSGHRAVWGRCWEAGAAPPLWPWIQVLRALEPGDELRTLLDGGDAAHGPIAPDRFELFDAVCRRLARATAQHLAVVILEDLHVADRATLLLLELVAQQVRGTQLLVVGTYRDGEARLAADRAELLARIGRCAELLPLGRLARADVAHLVVDAMAVGPDDPLIDEVYRTTEGNPLFVSELLRLLEARGPSIGATTIPDGVRAAIRLHVARLQPASRELVETASVLGRDVSLPVLAAVVGDELSTIEERIAEVSRARILVQAGPRAYRFSHVLVRDTLYDDLPARRRADLHRRAAEVLVARARADPSPPLADIARHFAAAGPDFAEAAIDYAVRASRAARAQLAFEEAVPLLEHALETLAETAPDAALRRGELLVELGEACIEAGDGEAGRRACRQAAALARSIGSRDLLARAALAFGLLFTFGRVDEELVTFLEEALASLDERSPELRARLLARLAGALQPARDPAVPIARAREAIALARGLDENTLLAVLVGAGSALQDIAHPRERMPLNRQLLALASARGDRILSLRGHARLAFDCLESGDPAAADAEMRTYERLAQGLRQPRHHFLPAMWWAMRALSCGRWDEHASRLAAARRLGAADPNAARCLACHEFLAARLRGERSRAGELAAGARWFLDAMPASVAFTEALLLADRGLTGEARAALQRVSAEEHAASVPTIMRSLLVEAVAAADDAALAARLHAALLPFADRVGAWSMTAMYCDGPVSRHLALLAATAGLWDEADAHWEQATLAARAQDMRPILLHLALERAEMLSRRGAGDSETIARLADEARREAEALGLPELSSRARALATPAPAPIDMRLEGEYWEIAGDGERCRLHDSRGLRMLAQLVEHPGRELHATELVGAAGLGDGGVLLDGQAKASYRERLHKLEEEIAQAEKWNDTARGARARDEVNQLTAELARAVGLGGRDRRAGSAAERARINAQRRLSDAIKKIQAACPNLGRKLAGAVRTGSFCWYDPTSRKRPTA